MPDPQAKAFFLTLDASGLGELREALVQKEQAMSVLGARLLSVEKRGIESAQTASIHRAGENSVLASIAQSISISLTHTLELLRDWSGNTGDISIVLNKEFTPNAMTAQDLQALVASWQSGSISQETLFFNMRRAEMIEPEITFQDEMDRIAANPAHGGLL